MHLTRRLKEIKISLGILHSNATKIWLWASWRDPHYLQDTYELCIIKKKINFTQLKKKKKKNLKYTDTFSKLHYFLHKHPFPLPILWNIILYLVFIISWSSFHSPSSLLLVSERVALSTSSTRFSKVDEMFPNCVQPEVVSFSIT